MVFCVMRWCQQLMELSTNAHHTSLFDGETYIDQMTMKSGCNNRITGLGTMSNTGQWLVFATTGALLLLQQQVVWAQVPGVVECNNPRKS